MAVLDYVAGFTLLVGALYLYIGRVVSRRAVGPEAQGAQNAFLVWWYGLGASQLLSALQIIMFRLDSLSIPMYQILAQVNLFLVVAALWGLLYYLIYLYSGNTRWFWPLTGFYAVYYVWLVWLIVTGPAIQQIVDDRWSLGTVPESSFSTAALMVLLFGLIGPQIGAAIAYLRLFRRLTDPSQKYRVAMVSIAIIIWFGLALVSSLVSAATGSDFTDGDAYQLFQRTIGLAAVLAMLFAYRPPRRLQEKYGIQPA